MVDSKQFLCSFPFLKSIGINTIDQVKEKLIFEGKINSETIKQWQITGVSYSCSLIELRLTIKNLHEVYKITYKEGIFEYKGKSIAIIKHREKVTLRNFNITVKNKPINVVEELKKITIFPIKKAS